MHHQDRDTHRHGFNHHSHPRIRPPRTWDALRWLKWTAAILLILLLLGVFGVHP